jgi:dolichol-phosphate mannosyltransferase
MPQANSMTGTRTPLLSVVAPCFNEADVVELFYQELRPILASLEGMDFEIILVDDGSSDDTLLRMNRIAAGDPSVRACSLSRNFGHQVALTAGLEAAAGDVVVLMDSDLQHPPRVIPALVQKWRDGFDVVSAMRRQAEGETWFKTLSSRGFYVFFNSLSATKIPEGVADFCLLSRRACSALKQMPERHRVLRGLVAWAGFQRTFVPYEQPPRAAGHTKFNMTKMVGLALDAVFSFSAEPLRLALRLGLAVTFLGFAYLAWTLIQGYVLHALVPGYASLIGIVMILGGCQLSFLGLIGQYLARVFEEVKGRPLYLFKQDPPAPQRSAAGVQAGGVVEPRVTDGSR